jgi:apolipoprotein N-acyltransferase
VQKANGIGREPRPPRGIRDHATNIPIALYSMTFILPVLTGLFLAASFPRADQGYFAWIAFVPLIFFILRARSAKGAFAGGFLAGFVEFFLLLMWMPAVLAHHGGLPPTLAWIAYGLLIGLLACYPAAACALVKYPASRSGESYILLFPFIWVTLEYAQSFSPFGGLPWLAAGYSQSRFLNIIQIADITGIYGLSFLLVWTGTAIVWFIRRRDRGFIACAPVLLAVLLIAGCLVYGRVSLHRWENLHPRFQAAMLQGNLSFDEPYPALLDKFRDGYVRMASRLKSLHTDLLVLPESPSPLFYESDADYRKVIGHLAARFPFGLVFNNVRSKGNGESRYYNSAYFLDRGGFLTGIYDKIHLVPFGEYIPLKRLFSFVETISKDVSAFAPGNDYRVVEIGGHPANAIICFEAVFPPLVRRFVQKGSQLIINLTNDGWYGDSAAPYQHLAISRFRAVENRRYLLRSTNSGISAFIEPTGRLQAATGILREAICEGRFDFIAARTLYTRYGDVFVLLCAIISCGSGVWAGLRNAAIHTGIDKRYA